MPPVPPLSPLFAVLAVGSGGFVGAVARYGMSRAVQRFTPGGTFPTATFAVNLIGCVAIGALATHLLQRDPPAPEALRLVLLTGLLGAFTTFSTFGLETLTLMRDRHLGLALAYVGGSVVLGVLGVALGRALVLR
jgi:CrcB protein